MPTMVEVDPESCISVPMQQFRAGLKCLLGEGEVEAWDKFCFQMAVIVDSYYRRKLERVRNLMENTACENHQVEETHHILQIMSKLFGKAQYTPLSETVYTAALEGWFNFCLPADIAWHVADRENMSTFVENSEIYPKDAIPEFARHILIFTRGTGEATQCEYFVWEKIDLLIDHFIPSWKRSKKATVPSTEQSSQAAGSQFKVGPPQAKSIFKSRPFKRQSLEDVVRRDGWKRTLLSKVTITEPTFHNVVVMFRRAPPDPANKRPKHASVGLWAPPKKPKHMEIQRFENIPYADIEAMLPIQNIELRPFDRSYFVIQLLLCVYFIVVSFASLRNPRAEGGGQGPLLFMLGILMAVVSKIYTVLFAFHVTKQQYYTNMQDWLRTKRVGNGKVVVSRLLEEVQEQEFKELVLAYFVLWKQGPFTFPELEAAVEKLLHTQFGVVSEFDVSDGINKLLLLGLAVRDESTRFYKVALTPAEYVEQHSGLQFLSEVELDEKKPQ
eukprot:NODE_445_length_1666_cov_264.972171_g312_i1.p1 GENE.NODE_445_length_1666_cov_264.972171_g312_i1~~NODE_445_length_1666_cov_264.972171_g312_i1.p1  ORF type:complete len:499 (-),score=96.67 NODE_445_length_1666_cov_264.972171_g312_i1:83-1579(-)